MNKCHTLNRFSIGFLFQALLSTLVLGTVSIANATLSEKCKTDLLRSAERSVMSEDSKVQSPRAIITRVTELGVEVAVDSANYYHWVFINKESLSSQSCILNISGFFSAPKPPFAPSFESFR